MTDADPDADPGTDPDAAADAEAEADPGTDPDAAAGDGRASGAETPPSRPETGATFERQLGRTAHHTAAVRAVLAVARAVAPDAALALGAGAGDTAAEVARVTGADVTGVDRRPEAVALARDRHAALLAGDDGGDSVDGGGDSVDGGGDSVDGGGDGGGGRASGVAADGAGRLSFEVGEMREWVREAAPDDLPELVVLCRALHHLPSPAAKRALLAALRAGVPPGGVVVVVEAVLPGAAWAGGAASAHRGADRGATTTGPVVGAAVEGLWARRALDGWASTFWTTLAARLDAPEATLPRTATATATGGGGHGGGEGDGGDGGGAGATADGATGTARDPEVPGGGVGGDGEGDDSGGGGGGPIPADDLRRARDAAAAAGRAERAAGDAVRDRDGEHLVTADWLVAAGRDAGFEVALAEPVTGLGEAAVVFQVPPDD